jgi:uncharacterized protein YcfJ
MADPNLESVVVPSRDAAKAINKGAHKTGSSSSPHNQDPGSNPNPDIESATAVPSPPKGDLINRAGQALGQVVHSPTGQAVGGLLKGAAKRALPLAGAALGGYVGGPLGATIGSSSSPHNQDPGSDPNPDIKSATAVPSPPKADLINRAGQALGQVVHSPTGQAVGGLLKGAAKRALPLAGAALGGYVGGPLGATIGSSLATAAGSALGLEAEVLNAEDREFEGAEKFVKMAGQAVKSAVTAPLTANPAATAQTTVMVAAKKIVPGLLKAELCPFLDLDC